MSPENQIRDFISRTVWKCKACFKYYWLNILIIINDPANLVSPIKKLLTAFTGFGNKKYIIIGPGKVLSISWLRTLYKHTYILLYCIDEKEHRWTRRTHKIRNFFYFCLKMRLHHFIKFNSTALIVSETWIHTETHRKRTDRHNECIKILNIFQIMFNIFWVKY